MKTEDKEKRKRFQWMRWLFKQLRVYLITGIVVILPSVVTIWVLWNLFAFIDREAVSQFLDL